MQILSLPPAINRSQISAAALVLLCFTALYVLLIFLLPPNATQIQAADPLVIFLLPLAGTNTLTFVAIAIAALWLLLAQPSRKEIKRSFTFMFAGVLAGLSLTLLVRIFYGATLPDFVPSEESAAPGMALGVGAGLIEEVFFRLGFLPLFYFLLRKFVNPWVATFFACLLTGLFFALSHQLSHQAGSAAMVFQTDQFITRMLIPGFAMSLVAILVHPAFMIAAHCSAHILIALLFVAAGN